MHNRMIGEIVSEHYVFAYVLFYFGIEFFEHTSKTLEELCMEKDLEVEQVLSSFDSIRVSPNHKALNLDEVPVELVVEYLKHSHHVFIKQRLPFLTHLVERLHQTGPPHPVVKDLQTNFPRFAEEFTQHICEEEDNIFAQIMYLLKVLREPEEDLFHTFSMLNNISIDDYASDHREAERDELFGIRELTQNYTLGASENIQMRVLMEDLRAFDQELRIHAKIENDILFRKGQELELEVWQRLLKRAALN